MALTLLLGGARSGKSRLAVRLAAGSGRPVAVVATGLPTDEEMAERIRRHRAERPAEWTTVEEPVELEAALRALPPGTCAVVDCLTLWVANLMQRGIDDEEIDRRAAGAAALAASRPGPTVTVSNEVGWGLVPMEALGRRYRDALGRTNATWAAAADRAVLVVAGRVVPLEPADAAEGPGAGMAAGG